MRRTGAAVDGLPGVDLAVLGLFFAWVVSLALESEGLGFAVPAGQIGLLLVFALLLGVGAAVLPARRAAKLDVLKASS